MPQRMEAEVLFLDPDDVAPGCAALNALGFEVEVLNWVDPYGPTVWIMARIVTELDAGRFLDWVLNIVEPLHGDAVQAGLCHPLQASA